MPKPTVVMLYRREADAGEPQVAELVNQSLLPLKISPPS